MLKEVKNECKRSKRRGILDGLYEPDKKERQSVIERLLRDKEFMEDLIDMAIIEQRRKEPSRPIGDYIAERKNNY